MLKCLKIEQLFGRFDYTIELQKFLLQKLLKSKTEA